MKSRAREQASPLLGSTNVYTGPGYRIPESMLVQTPLVSRNADLLEEKGMSQARATTVLGGAQPKLSRCFAVSCEDFWSAS